MRPGMGTGVGVTVYFNVARVDSLSHASTQASIETCARYRKPSTGSGQRSRCGQACGMGTAFPRCGLNGLDAPSDPAFDWQCVAGYWRPPRGVPATTRGQPLALTRLTQRPFREPLSGRRKS